MRAEADVVVVGAGFAGLAAARSVVAAGREAIVLEARDRVGGRVLNAEIGDGKVVEMGGQWIGPTQERIASLAAELGVETFPTHTAGANLLRLGGKLRRYSGTIPRLGPLVLVDIARGARKLNRLADGVDPDAPWAADDAARLDAISLGAWVDRQMRTRPARAMMRAAVRTAWGTEPEDLSLLHACFYLRAAGSFELITDTEGGAQQDRFVGGSQLVALRAAEELGERIVLSSPVSRVEHGPAGVKVIAGGATFRARRAIVAVPPPLVDRIDFAPSLPAARRQLGQRMAQGWLIKATAVYDEPFWRADDLSGEALDTGGLVSMTFDNTPADGSPGALVAFIGGRNSLTFSALGTSERRRTVLACLRSIFGPRAARAERYLEQDWAAEPWSGGGPVCNFATGGWTATGPALREPFGVVHWAGTETATKWAGYMDGAVGSGERAAAEALAAL